MITAITLKYAVGLYTAVSIQYFHIYNVFTHINFNIVPMIVSFFYNISSWHGVFSSIYLDFPLLFKNLLDVMFSLIFPNIFY